MANGGCAIRVIVRLFHSWQRRLKLGSVGVVANAITLLEQLVSETNDTSVICATLELSSNNDHLIILKRSSLDQACLIDGSNPIKAAGASEQSQRDNEDGLPEFCYHQWLPIAL